jgi:small ligand-binding sensory domain FIST
MEHCALSTPVDLALEAVAGNLRSAGLDARGPRPVTRPFSGASARGRLSLELGAKSLVTLKAVDRGLASRAQHHMRERQAVHPNARVHAARGDMPEQVD